MKSNPLTKKPVLKLTAMLATVVASSVNAGPTLVTITNFTVGEAPKAIVSTMDSVGPESNSFYSPTMGHTGWTHSSAWGYTTLKKGVPVKIEATAADGQFHPGIAVWQVAGKAPVDNGKATENGIFITSFKPWEDVIVDKVAPELDSRQRSLKMLFITNGIDRDGWDTGDTVPVAYDHGLVKRIPDGVDGKVAVTFIPPANGKYVFVVGGINPDVDLQEGAPDPAHGYPNGAAFVEVKVTVTQN